MFDAQATIAAVGAPLAGLSADSRALSPNDGFLAYPGHADDGRRHIGAAVAAGAAAVFWEHRDFEWRDDWRVPNQAVVDLRDKAGYLADIVYDSPSHRLPVVAVTGTNGKTTITHFAAQLLEASGQKAGIVGTLGYGDRRALSPLANTTPDAVHLQALLRQWVNAKTAAAFIEASSHGIRQGRLNGVRLAAAVFANAGRDHLDYHGSLERYWQSKAALFESPLLEKAILNADDAYCAELATRLPVPVFTFGKNGKALRLLATAESGGVTNVDTDGMFGRRRFRFAAIGAHNVQNFLAAVLAARLAGGGIDEMSDCAPVLPCGRMQKIHDHPAVYVDYAHTPDALAAVLKAAAAVTAGGRLWVLFGCGGERDSGKRVKMGDIAARAADAVFVTDDNPRGEEAAAIRDTVYAAARATGNSRVFNVGGRKNAIAAVLAEAAVTDTVLILGKGHETTQHVGGEVLPFSDAVAVKAALAEK